jgi:hypothetical protein
MRNRRGCAICEWAMLTLCARLVVWQLFISPSLGLADNNDYAKLIGRVCLGGEHPLFEYVEFEYHHAPDYCWNSGLITSAVWPLRVALAVAKPFSGDRFDLRWLGAVYAVLSPRGVRSVIEKSNHPPQVSRKAVIRSHGVSLFRPFPARLSPGISASFRRPF